MPDTAVLAALADLEAVIRSEVKARTQAMDRICTENFILRTARAIWMISSRVCSVICSHMAVLPQDGAHRRVPETGKVRM